MIVLTVILGLMVVILGYTTFNLLKKLEKQEDIINNQATILAS
jgi:heme/copper-type cytochrome/quinol oxidase subunit 2